MAYKPDLSKAQTKLNILGDIEYKYWRFLYQMPAYQTDETVLNALRIIDECGIVRRGIEIEESFKAMKEDVKDKRDNNQ